MSSYSTSDGAMSLHRHLQARHRSRPGASAGAEPRRRRPAAAAGRGAPPRRHHAQELARPDDGRAHAVAGRELRPALHLQLRADPGARPAAAARRRRRHQRLRRARVFAARLARPRQARRPTRSPPPTWCAALQEQNVQVAGGALGAPPAPTDNAFQLIVHDAGPLRATCGSSARSSSSRRGRPAGARSATWRGVELGGARLRHQLLSQRQAGRRRSAIFQRPGTNALAGRRRRHRQDGASSSRTSRTGIDYRIVYNPTEFIAAVGQRGLQDAVRGAAARRRSSSSSSCSPGAPRSSRSSPSRSR